MIIMVDGIPSLFGPDATCDRHLLVREAAGNHHAGAGQCIESERDFYSLNVERCKERNKP